MPYCEVIKEIMLANNLSQQKFADIIGVNQTTISQWLLGRKKPSYDNILSIYEKFDIEPNVLFGIKY
ncbi:MAG: helix-turn-helix domain-containing protein [Clostridia bacterium]|nr:helix-turn-helix domain-containing protein [Clostridia bacterium]MDE7328588.1 helix-turn-helix domain-containing protein [Clostridia bacterium]